MIDYDKLRRIMKYNKINIKEMSNRINVHYKTLEYDFKKKDMKVSILLKICKELDICIKDIIIKVDD